MPKTIAVLTSGGLDSAVLLGWASKRYWKVQPVCVEAGLRWEDAERAALHKFLEAARFENVLPPARLFVDCRDIYSGWMLAGKVPAGNARWTAVGLPGRNLLLLAKAAVYCSLRNIPTLAIGLLSGNPFPDSRAPFFRAFERASRLATGSPISVQAPFRRLHKDQVVRLGAGLPLHLTLSCIAPKRGVHCGTCSKCVERKGLGFRDAKVLDKTRYLS